MKTTFKFKGLTHQGKIIHFKHEFDCPEFKTIKKSVLTKQPINITVDSQLLSWLDDQDKLFLMDIHDLSIIIDYSVYKKSNKSKVTIKDYLIYIKESSHIPDQLKIDIFATYSKIKDTIKNQPINKQIELILSHLSVAYDASIASYKDISCAIKQLDQQSIEESHQPKLN